MLIIDDLLVTKWMNHDYSMVRVKIIDYFRINIINFNNSSSSTNIWNKKALHLNY